MNLDTVAPSVALTGANDGAVYPLSAPPAPVCRATDSVPGSGLRANSNLALSPLGGGVGSFTATCSGVLDRAGNAAASVGVHYTVGYAFGRFMPPLPRPESALICSALVVGIPCGNPGYTFSVAFFIIFAEIRADAPMGTIWSSSP